MKFCKAGIVGFIKVFLLILNFMLFLPYAHAQSPYVTNGLNWLKAVQNPEGKWGNINGIRDTHAVIDAYFAVGKTHSGYMEGIAWLTSAVSESFDYTARRIATRAAAGVSNEAELSALVQGEQGDTYKSAAGQGRIV